MPSIRLPRVTRQGGAVTFRFGKEAMEFASLAEARQFAREALTPDVLKALAISRLLTRRNNAANDPTEEGKRLDVDFSLDSWGRVV